MENVMTIFKNEEFGEIRTMRDERSGEPWFCANDVCNALGYRNQRDAIKRHIDEGDVVKYDTPTVSGIQTMVYLNESGLYSLILSSKLPHAKQFKRWVTSEVLPIIRKTGAYMTVEAIRKSEENPDYVKQLTAAIKSEKEKLALSEELRQKQIAVIGEQQLTIHGLEQEVESMRAKSAYLDRILSSKGVLTSTQVAYDYGWDARNLHKELEKHGIIKLESGQWMLQGKARQMPFSRSKDLLDPSGHFLKQYTVWTPLGRAYLYLVLKKCGFVPLCERDITPTLFDNIQ